MTENIVIWDEKREKIQSIPIPYGDIEDGSDESNNNGNLQNNDLNYLKNLLSLDKAETIKGFVQIEKLKLNHQRQQAEQTLTLEKEKMKHSIQLQKIKNQGEIQLKKIQIEEKMRIKSLETELQIKKTLISELQNPKQKEQLFNRFFTQKPGKTERKKVSEEEKQRIIEMRGQNKSFKQIQEQFDGKYHENTIRNIFKKRK